MFIYVNIFYFTNKNIKIKNKYNFNILIDGDE